MKTKFLIKSVLIVLSFLLIFSCDPPVYFDYFITNNCDEVIDVKFEVSQWGTPEIKCTIIQINPYTTQLIHSAEYYTYLEDYMVEHFFKRGIVITKGSDTSKVNYVDKDLWEFKKTSKNHANSYLTVYPEDFE